MGILIYYWLEETQSSNNNLPSAIRSTYNKINKRKLKPTDYLLILIDGLFNPLEKKNILQEINYCILIRLKILKK